MKPYITALMLAIATSLSAQPVFNVKDYGAVGDGKTNDIAALRKVAAAVCQSGGGTVVFEQGKTYLVKLEEVPDERPVNGAQENATIMGVRDCNSVKVSMNGATILLASNHRMEYVFFHFLNCKSFALIGGSLIGDAVGHDYSDIVRFGKRQKSSHEWGFGVLVNGSKGIIRDMKISYMTGDGIKSGSITLKNKGTYHTTLTVDNTEISYCRRNGIAILSSLGTTIQNTSIHHIGTYGKLIGTAPQAGIDIEYEDGVGDGGDVTIKNCRITDCTQKVISASNSTPPVPDNFLVEDCYLEGSSFQVYHVKKAKSKLIRNCTVVRCPIHLGDAHVENTRFDLGLGVHYVSGGHYKDCSFIGTLEKSESNYGCTLAGTNLNETVFEKCTFSDIRTANNNSPSFQGFAGYHFPLRAIFKNCTISNCSFVRGNEKNASSFAFYDSKLMNGCMIYNLRDDIPITFERCELTDVSAYQTQTGRFIFKKSTLVQKDKSVAQPLLLFGNNSFERCTIVDEVGFPVTSAKKHGIKAYKVEADRTDFTFDADNVKTEGMTLKRGKVYGVSKTSFKGTQRSVKFK